MTWVEIPRVEKKPLPTDDCMQIDWFPKDCMQIGQRLGYRRADRLVQEGARETESRKQGSQLPCRN
jgi:hypothetical protein